MGKTFGERVRELRIENGMTLKELSKQSGSSTSYLWEIEHKPSICPSAEKTYKLAVALGTTVEQLLGELIKESPEDQVFFRDYKKLRPKTKKQLRSILNVLKKEN